MNKLLLLSGNDIPFVQGQVNIVQPKIKDIAFLGEEIFYLGCNFLCFSKDSLEEKDKINLQNKTNFDILMSIVNNKTEKSVVVIVNAIQLVLSLIFPNYSLKIMPNMFLLTKQIEEDKTKQQVIINTDNFEAFKQILEQMFCLKATKGNDYNPANKKAEQIAQKLRQRKKQLSQKNGEKQSVDILSRYISILNLGNSHTIAELMEYTIFQLFDEFKRFERKYSYDIWFQAKLAGAQNLQDVSNWMVQEDQEKIPSRPRSGRIEF